MKLVLLSIGRMKAGPERDILRRYLERAEALARGVGIGGVTVVELDESRARSPDQRKRDEALALQAKLPGGACVFLLDERGKALRSADIATEIGRMRDEGVPACCFVIGGADGLDPAFLAAYRGLSFGAATFPHQFVRVMMAEQLYRAITILSGHPYHRD